MNLKWTGLNEFKYASEIQIKQVYTQTVFIEKGKTKRGHGEPWDCQSCLFYDILIT